MNYCPRCGTKLGVKFEGGRDRPACPSEGCGFFDFGLFSIGCGGVVIRENRALLVQRGINPNRGAWQIPGGYVESDEQIVPAVEREVLEEAGVTAKVSDVIGVRHVLGAPSANIYVVFRLQPVSGEPRFDGGETIGAGYFSLEELDQMDNVQEFSMWSINRALKLPVGSGLILEHGGVSIGRPGWSLFGLPERSGLTTLADPGADRSA